MKKSIWKCMRIGAGMLLFLAAVRCQSRVRSGADTILVFLEQSGLDHSRIADITKKEAGQETPAFFCFWEEHAQTPAVCPETGRTSILTEIAACGETELVIAGGESLRLNPGSCMIDPASAEELFGTQEVQGQRLQCAGTFYTVSGVFESGRRILLREARDEEPVSMNYLSIRFAGSTQGREEADQFLMRNGLAGESVDLHLPAALAGNLCLLCPLLLARELLLAVMEVRAFTGVLSRKKKVFLASLCAAAAILLFWTLRCFLEIPAELIPSRWSDFSFWGTLWEQQEKNILLALSTALGERQLQVLSGLLRVCFYNLFAAVLVS